MLLVALKMLIGNKVSFFGVIFGIFLATLLISQQAAIFLGLVSRSYRLVTDIQAPDVWVIDPATESDGKVRGMPENYLAIVRSIPHIAWAVPIKITDMPLILPSGTFEICQLYGIDDATLIGAPQVIVEGNIQDMHREGGVVVDIYSAKGSLAQVLPDGQKIPLKLGDTFEINGHRAVVVAFCKITQGFYPQPIIFTTVSQFKRFSSNTQKNIQFIAAKVDSPINQEAVVREINQYKMLNGLTREQLKDRISESFLKTGILINFGLSVGLGIIIGFSIAGQIFYTMTLQNLMYYALIKAMGGSKSLIAKMIAIQVLVVGIIGYLIGTGVTLLWGMAIKDTTLAFLFPWKLLAFTSLIALIICLFTAALSMRKVFSTDPKALMGN